MARLVGSRQIGTFIAGYCITIAAVIFGPATAFRILDQHPAPATGTTIAAIALGTLSLVPVVLLTTWMYRRSDEYERHRLLLSGTIGFAIAFLLIATLDFLSHTELLPGWTWSPRWWTMIGAWIAAFGVIRIAGSRDT